MEIYSNDPAREALRSAYRAILAWPKKATTSRDFDEATEVVAEPEPAHIEQAIYFTSAGEKT
jgi:hypothetical protein